MVYGLLNLKPFFSTFVNNLALFSSIMILPSFSRNYSAALSQTPRKSTALVAVINLGHNQSEIKVLFTIHGIGLPLYLC